MPDKTDAQILQVVCRQGRQDHLVDLIFAECRLIPFEAKAPQPTPGVHHRALTLAANAPHLLALLRPRRERPRRRRAAEQRDEFATFQLIEWHSAPAARARLQDIELTIVSQPTF